MTATITAAAATAAPAERSRRSRAVTDAERARIRALRDHHSIREIARITGRSPHTVGRIVPRGRQVDGVPTAPPAHRTCCRCRRPEPVNLFIGQGRVCVYCRDENPLLPTYPLVPLVRRYMRLEDVDVDGACERMRIDPRTWGFWVLNARDVRLSVAEEALHGLDRFWWDAYNPVTVRYAARVIMEERTRRKKYGDGDYGLVREIVARRRVGDLGPNLRELARIRRAFEGPAISVCRWCDDRRERVDLSGGDPRVRWRRCGCGGPLAWTTEPDQPAARAA
jgi:DNA-binding CsgD family transcriptional regulator